ncbi:MAG: hypothetical protein AVDCRST_MAG40-2068 [uncultured Gemmatimonadaceae bacterium]|uniref:YtkA-like domain-containing protein n=1 Tax=uncultured Gemmatimonadaceae bacterium TaxID=246130 RepID=A0A6J4LHI9_9BACT|nr:MAG: hypothetical protein AVDCRST_MAG40-2068 [uncultured Gemmatimonadaceae bacterium]
MPSLGVRRSGRARHRPRPRPAHLLLVAALTLPGCVAVPGAAANGGTLRLASAAAGPYAVSVYTSPSPLAPGPVDVGLLVQRPGSTAVVDGATVAITGRATRERATNKLYYAAAFVLPEAGRWRIDATVGGAAGTGDVGSEVAVGGAGLPVGRLALASLLATLALAAAWRALRARRHRREIRTGA